MTQPAVAAVLFAKDARRVGQFYAAVFGATVLAQDEYHAALDVRGFRLTVHEIPTRLARGIEISKPPLRRETGALRLDFPVDDLARAQSAARQLGGEIDSHPPSWASADSRFVLGHDPEGNVFGVSVRD